MARDDDPTGRLDAGDARTLAALYDRHAAAMYSLAMRIAGEPADAEAVIQEVFAAAWSEARRRPGMRAPDLHRLLSTTRVHAIDHVREFGAEAPAVADATGNDPATAADDASAGALAGDVATLHVPDPAQGRVTDEYGPEDAPRLRAAFRGLPPLERLAIELAYFEGLTISRIAARLEEVPDTANARLRSGLRRLAGGYGAQRTSDPRHDMPATRDLAGLYALGALNASERAAFEAHVEVHRESVDEVLALLPVTRRLAWAAPPHEPPSGLRDRVIEAVTGAPLPNVAGEDAPESSRTADVDAGPEPAPEDGPEPVEDGDGPEPVETTGGAEPWSTEPVPAVEEADPSSPTSPWQEPTPDMQQPTPTAQKATPDMQQPTPIEQKKGGRWGLLSLAAGSLVVAASLGVFAARQANLVAALQENLDAANTQARIAELETAAAQQTADELREGTRVLTAADVRTLDLGSQPAAPAARGRLFWSPSDGGLLTATGLPPVPPGRVYQLWFIPEATPLSAGLLPADAEGRVMAAVTPPDGVTEPVPAAVTLEPAGGATTPGGDVYLLGRP